MNANATISNDSLELVIRPAGFALAHAVWGVSNGETLCTLALSEKSSERRLYRFEADSLAESVENARQLLQEAQPSVDRWVLAFDGYLYLENQRTDALVMQVWGAPEVPARIIQKYRPAKYLQHFKILGNPVFVDDRDEIFESSQLQEWLVQGIMRHEKVAQLWKKWFQPG
jgi:hypothetical protein